MIEAIARKWVKALRSGDYQQGRGLLRTPDDRYCCLGVLGAILGNSSEELKGRAYLSEDMREQSGVYYDNGARRDYEGDIIPGYSSLVDANDQGCTFNEIADAIEANWRNL